MAKQTIGIGTAPNDGTGDDLRTCFDKCNDNFSELYAASFADYNAAKNTLAATPFSIVSDATINTAFVIGGASGSENYVGNSTAVPTGISGADSGYVAGIIVVNVIGGYDNVANQTGGAIVASNHSILRYSAEGHGVILGGSTNDNAGGRCSIIGSTVGDIGSACFQSVMIGCNTSSVDNSNYGTMIAGQTSTLEGSYNVFLSTTSCTSGASTSRNVISGISNSVTGGTKHNVIFGWTITSSADYASGVGSDITITHEGARVHGRFANSPGKYSDTISLKILENNDARIWRQVDYVRTTNATLTNATNMSALPAGKKVAGQIRIAIVALQDGSADGDNSGNYAMGTWEGTFGFYWDGTNGIIHDAATEVANTSPTFNIPTIRDNITVAAVPILAVNGNVVRAKVTGHATKTINWVIKYDITSTLVS